jgi:putative ABC transport system permease protein
MSLVQDLRFAARLLFKGRWFTLAAAATLALGISVNTAVFTLADAVLFRGAPVKDADRVVAITMRDLQAHDVGVSYLDFRDWRPAVRTLSSMSLMALMEFNVNEDDHVPDRYSGAAVSSTLFDIIGETPLIGRALTAADDRGGAAPVVLLSYGVWQTRYGGQASVLGRTIKVNNMLTTVVGVMRPGMQFPPNTDIWLALERSPFARSLGRDSRIFQVVGRLADGVTVPQAQGELATIVSKLAEDYPRTNKDVAPNVGLYNERVLGARTRLVFWALMGAVAFVLLIACANVANLQLARAADRAKEIGIRISLGASRGRIVQQLLVESVLLALFGGLLGIPISILGIRAFDASTQTVGKPYWMTFAVDAHVLAFFFTVCVATGVLFGLAPALHVAKTNVNETMNEGGRSAGSGVRARRWASGMLIAEVAFMVVLLAGAGLMMRSFLALYDLDLGIDTSRLLVMQLTLNDRKYPTQEMKRTFMRRLDDRLTTISALEAVTTASHWPLNGGLDFQFAVEGRVDPSNRLPIVTMVNAGRRYFDTLGLKVPRGRAFNDEDSAAGHEGAIVNQRLAETLFSGEDPIGQRIRLIEAAPTGVRLAPLTIVGVAANLRQHMTPNLDPDPVVYVHDLAIPSVGRPTALIVRAHAADPGPITRIIREEVRALDIDIPVVNIQTLDQNLAQQRWSFRVFGAMFAAFAVIAVLLAAVGIYAVTAYSVTQRTQEIGVRTALGAQPSQVIWLFLRRALAQVAIGLAIGLVGAIGVGKILESLLIRTSSRDPVTLASIVVLTIVVAVAACFWPAQRATRLDPLAALRHG